MRKTLFIGCHPDDIELGCAGTVRCFVDHGYEVLCVFLTRGDCGGDAAVRAEESRRACRILGVSADHVFFGMFPDTRVPDSAETIAFLEGFCGGDVAYAFVPSVNEVHQDHRHASHSCVTAFRRIPRLFAYESPSVTPAFTPSAFVDITRHIRDKRAALKCHASQIRQRRMYLDYRSMLRLAAFRGSQIGVRFAESFEVVRLLVEVPSTEAVAPLDAAVSAGIGETG